MDEISNTSKYSTKNKQIIDEIDTIKVNNLSYKYPNNNKYVLKDINFEINKNSKSEKTMNIEFGKYEIPFQVVQGSGESRSMGDKGFYHPAILVVEKDCQYIVLKSKEIYYKSKTSQILKGKLQELYYLDTNMAWVLSKQKEESNWIIPLKEILYQKDDFEKASVGIIKIKVAATTMKMPESIAEITFNFKLLKKIEE